MKPNAHIPYIAALADFSSAQLREALLSQGALLPLTAHNWADSYPYAPQVTARMAYTDSALVVMFDVTEEHTKAVELCSNGKVWEDSCVELFVSNPIGEGYFNFECNAIGTLLAAKRLSREVATHFSQAEIDRVVRFCSLEHRAVDNCQTTAWWVIEIIPFDLLGLDSAPKALKANLYKCGDKLRRPHFMSWSAVGCATPDFHRPEYFGELTFESYE